MHLTFVFLYSVGTKLTARGLCHSFVKRRNRKNQEGKLS
jgi:hypothetical protein